MTGAVQMAMRKLERNLTDSGCSKVISTVCPAAVLERLTPAQEFWEPSKTLKFLAEGGYFRSAGAPPGDEDSAGGAVDWPESLRRLMDDSSSLGLVAKDDCSMAVRSLGALCWYLSRSKLDDELLSAKSFRTYVPVDEPTPPEQEGVTGDQQGSPGRVERAPSRPDSGEVMRGHDRDGEVIRGRRLVLDAMTLSNLDVLVNSSLGGTGQGTLLGRLNTCSTPFGQRLLRAWMCAPLCQPESIADRQKAVAFLAERPSLLTDLEKLLKPLPDLERLLNKIHSLGSGLRARNHPDSRAVFFDLALYGRKRIHDFLSTLDALDKSRNVLDLFRDQGDKN